MDLNTEQKIIMLIEHYRKKNLSNNEIVLLIRGIFLQCEENKLNSIFESKLGMKFEEISEQLELNWREPEKKELIFVTIEIPAALLKNIPEEEWQNYIAGLIKADRGL